TRSARHIVLKDSPTFVCGPSFPHDTTHGAGRWGARCGSARHRYAWPHHRISIMLSQDILSKYMSTFCIEINSAKKARALQLQGSSLQQSFYKRWNFRLTLVSPDLNGPCVH